MKKVMIIAALAFTLAACGSGSTTEVTTDSTVVDSTAVDSVKVDTPAIK
jgi:uncharacterized protein YcfL